jgi:hypothetical protein
MRQVFSGWGVALKRKVSKDLRYIFRTRCYIYEDIS